MQKQATPLVVFSDLDATLIGCDDYGFSAALPALLALRQASFPLIFCSSKTASEIQHHQSEMGLEGLPFVAENGGVIAVPRTLVIGDRDIQLETTGVLKVGKNYESIRKALSQLASGINRQLVGFGDWDSEQLKAECGLSPAAAQRAKDRLCSEPFRFEGGDKLKSDLLRKNLPPGFHLSEGGRYFLLHGYHDKASGVSHLLQVLRDAGAEFITVGLGDAPADLGFLQLMNQVFVLPQPDGSFKLDPAKHGFSAACEPAPTGWNQAIMQLL